MQWQMNEPELSALLAQTDSLELSGVMEDKAAGFCEAVETYAEAQFFSVYSHVPDQGADCIADFDTLSEAREWATALANAHGWEVTERGDLPLIRKA